MRIYELLERVNTLLDDGFHFMPGHVAIKEKPMLDLLDRIKSSLPEDCNEASIILKRRDEIIIEAQNRADRIIADAQNEASRILSENEIMRAVHLEGQKIREQVIQDCENIKHRAFEEANNVRVQAADEALKIKQGSENYAELVFTNIDTVLAQLQQSVKNSMNHLEQMKEETQQGITNQRSVGQSVAYDDFE